jgi:UDP-3-O-[3-hydroxymyristoyl] glucosamine N-acyltransferase
LIVSLKLADILAELPADSRGDAELEITRIASLEDADASSLSFLAQARYAAQLQSTQAACVIVSPAHAELASARGACIITPDPYLYFAKVTQLWKRRHVRPGLSDAPLVHPTAVISPLALIHPTARIGALCVLEAGAQIGADTVLKTRVTVHEDCQIGQRCIVHSGVVIGADGFGFAMRADGTGEKIEQLGAVRIGDDVEIGANTCIDRGALSDTHIADGVKIDNLVQIGHNVRIGAHTAIAGCVGIAGSATVGAYCFLGGGAIVLGHLTVADKVNISAASVVTRNIAKSGQYSGVFPLDDNASWEKNAATLRQLYSLRERIKTLERAQS